MPGWPHPELPTSHGIQRSARYPVFKGVRADEKGR